MITKKDLENATQRLTDVSERINLGLRFEIEMGSGTQGSPYRLHEWNPSFTHARLTEIGQSRAKALRWIEGYEAALLTVERQLKARGKPRPEEDFGTGLPPERPMRSFTFGSFNTA